MPYPKQTHICATMTDKSKAVGWKPHTALGDSRPVSSYFRSSVHQHLTWKSKSIRVREKRIISAVAGGLNHDVTGPIGVRWVPAVRGLHYDYSGGRQLPILQRPTSLWAVYIITFWLVRLSCSCSCPPTVSQPPYKTRNYYDAETNARSYSISEGS